MLICLVGSERKPNAIPARGSETIKGLLGTSNVLPPLVTLTEPDE